jgi:hypothetical protein
MLDVPRFVSEDPLRLRGGLDSYQYVRDRPTISSDPFGLRELTSREKDILKPYIPQPVLDNADLQFGYLPVPASPDFAAMTIDNVIYFRNPNQTFCTPADFGLLGHELVHARQYRDEGMTVIGYLWRARNGYGNSPDEVPAYAMQRRITNELRPEVCTCGE